MTRGPRPDVRRRLLREWLRDSWQRLGSLYGSTDWDECEATLIRDECEARGGIPMGYGRVPRLPIQLNNNEAPRQFAMRCRR